MLVKLLVLKQNYREVFVLQIKTKNDIKKKKKKKKKKALLILSCPFSFSFSFYFLIYYNLLNFTNINI